MKKKKLKGIFLTLLTFISVFLFAGALINSNSVPIVADALSQTLSQSETITTDFSVFESKFDENFDKRARPFSNNSISCSAYRYKKEPRQPNILYLLPKKYTGTITIEGIEPLPGQFFNTTPIKGITKIKICADTTGYLCWDDRLDFQHNYSKMFYQEITMTFTNNFPCFFKVTTTSAKLAVTSVEVTHDNYLGTVNTDLTNSGYDSYRLESTYWGDDSTKAAVTYDITYNPNHDGYKTKQIKIYESSAKYTNLYDCAEQLRLFRNRAQSLYIGNPAGYNRNDGYVKAFGDAYIKDQTYYEYDVPLAAGQTTRGTGRLVCFTKGVTSTGYSDTQSPQSVIVFTDDHYFTFVECRHHLVNGKPVWGKRFSVDIPITGSKWSPATTLTNNNKVPGSGTPDNPVPKDDDLKIYPSKPLNLALNETVQFKSRLTGDDGVIEYTSDNSNVASIDKNTGLLTAKGYGQAKIQAKASLYDFYAKKPISNTVIVNVRKSMTMTIEGDYQKSYYEGQTFNPEGLSVFINYDDGTRDQLDSNTCSWLNPDTGQKKLAIGQNAIKCVYKDNVTATLNGLNVVESLAPTSMKINYPSGHLVVNKPIELSVTVAPYGASDDVTWTLIGGGNKLEGNILTPLLKGSAIEVIATSTKNNLKVSSYFQVCDYITFGTLNEQKDLTCGDYIIGYTNCSYDPTLLGDSNSNYRSSTVDPLISTRIKIRKALMPGNYYYMQRSDNDLYLDFNSNDGVIKEDSTVPVANHIEILNSVCYIYSQDNSKVFQYNPETENFEMAAPNTLASVFMLAERQTLDNNAFICDRFISFYMQLDFYTHDRGYCKDEEHHYYKDAKEGFLRLQNDERLMLSTNEKYKPAWDRLNAWARANGETIHLDAQGNVTFNVLNSKLIDAKQDNDMPVILCVTLLSGFSFIAFLLIKRKQSRA